MNCLQKKKIAFMSIVNSVKGFVRTITGTLPLTLEGCVDEESIIDYTLYGQSVQNGTPTPETPVEVESVGEYDETTGKYKIPITVSGKNLFDKSEYIDDKGRIGFSVKHLVIGTRYTITSNKPLTRIKISKGYGSFNSVTYLNADGWYKYSFTMNRDSNIPANDTQYLYIGNTIGKSDFIADISQLDGFDIQLEEGTTATDYEPYHEPITTNIYLDEPLRKVGDYADYIKSVDLVNGTGTVASVVKEMVVDSSTRLYYSGLSTDSESAVFFNPKDVGSAKSKCDVLSNYFPTVETDGCQVWRNTLASNTSHFIKATNEIFEIDETDTTNDLKLKKIKAWLDAQKAINPVLCYYILKTPTETPITLPKIPTFKGTSILTVGTTIQPSNAEIEYYSNVKE